MAVKKHPAPGISQRELGEELERLGAFLERLRLADFLIGTEELERWRAMQRVRLEVSDDGGATWRPWP